MEQDMYGHDPIRSARFITGAVLLAGLLVLGLGFGLVFEQPGFGAVIGLGTWLVTMSVIRAARGQ
jgi:hypothetical protein